MIAIFEISSNTYINEEARELILGKTWPIWGSSPDQLQQVQTTTLYMAIPRPQAPQFTPTINKYQG
jgi:hypothetical protein